MAVNRFIKINKKDFVYWSKFFTKDEWEYCFNNSSPAQSLAGIYTAKEAVMKAVGKDLLGRPDRIAVQHLFSGQPVVKIDNKNRSRINISISHTRDMAAAVAISYER